MLRHRRLMENAQQIRDQENQQDCAEANPGAAASTPTAVSVVSSAAAENQQQDNDE
jgi:hypothetical protein